MQNVAAGRLTLPLARQRDGTTTTSPRGTIVTVGIGEILIQLGLTPLTAVVPSVSAALGVSALDGAWLMTVYILALAGTLLVSGRLGDLLGHRRMFGAGALTFAAATALAGLAPTFEVLLAARIGQGIGGAMISGNNLAIIARAVPTTGRARAIAIVATASSLAAVIGSALGTLAVQAGVWPLLFLGPLPLALLAAVRARSLPGSERSGGTVDWAGAALLVVTMTVLAFALNHPHGATSEVVMPVFHVWLPLLAIATGTAFIVVERRVRVPLMDWRQLHNAQFGAAVGVNAILHLTMMGAMFLGPLLVVQGLAMSILSGGALMVVVQASITATAYLGGWFYDRARAWWLRPAGASLLTLGLAAWAVSGWYESYAGLILAGLVAGLGSGVLLAVNNTVIMSTLPSSSRGVASGMLETTRHFGHAFGVTIPSAILATVVSGFGGELTSDAIRWGFVLGCIAMAGLAGAAVGLGVWKRG
ncbi:MAG: MFS transporter [Chloroflexi bacterium]|nr:MFS transporter [Chloroflexota bacterium]